MLRFNRRTNEDRIEAAEKSAHTPRLSPAPPCRGLCRVGQFWDEHHKEILEGVALGGTVVGLVCPVCAPFGFAIAATANLVSAAYDVEEGDYKGAALDVVGALTLGAGQTAEIAATATYLNYARVLSLGRASAPGLKPAVRAAYEAAESADAVDKGWSVSAVAYHAFKSVLQWGGTRDEG